VDIRSDLYSLGATLWKMLTGQAPFRGTSAAKELNDMHGLALALCWAAIFGHLERNPAEVERFASELVELSTRQNFPYWIALGYIFRGWALSASGNTVEGLSWIEDGIRNHRANSIIGMPYYLVLKAEALYLAGRTREALETIEEAEALGDRYEERNWCAEPHSLRGVFLAALGAEEAQIDASFCEAIRIAKEQKSVSLEKRAEGTYTEYRRHKASGSGGRGFRPPLTCPDFPIDLRSCIPS
jgi:tetratricopeptide (TPR) repeat protein